MIIHQIGSRSQARKHALLSGVEDLALRSAKEKVMFEVCDTLRSRRAVALFFAFLSGITAVSTAVVPGILHI